MSQLEDQLESIPGYGIAMDKYNDWAGEKFNNTNPFEDEEGNKRVLHSQKTTEKERRVWKKVQKSAWVHDKCFLGSCGVGMDCGLGLVPVAVFFLPGLGPLIMYVIHARLISMAQNELYLPGKLVAKLQTNILVDFLISLPPLIGAFLAWLNGCLTRNAGMLYVYLDRLAEKRAAGQAATYVGPLNAQNNRGVQPGDFGNTEDRQVRQEQSAQEPARTHAMQTANGIFKKKEPQKRVVVGPQQSGVR